jgi:hypothetical protein
MALQTAKNLNFKNKKIRMIIAGFPGIGKTTLSQSAPNPLLIDLDDGLDRVEPAYRKDRLICGSYDELINDLKGDLSAYQTLIIDTGGRLFEFIKPAVIREDVKNGKRDGALSLAGYGAAARKFQEFVELCHRLDKHLVIIFHAKEEKDNENTKLRIMIEGQMKDVIWQDMDLGGFVEMVGKKRTIGFTNCEKYYAKGTHGIKGTYEIPELTNGEENNFLTKLFDVYMKNMLGSVVIDEEETKIYDEAMSLLAFIESASTVEHINTFVLRIGELKHALTSERELKFAVHEKAKSLGLKYDKSQKTYIVDNTVTS